MIKIPKTDWNSVDKDFPHHILELVNAGAVTGAPKNNLPTFGVRYQKRQWQASHSPPGRIIIFFFFQSTSKKIMSPCQMPCSKPTFSAL